MNLTADGQTVMENRYRYDAVDNILGITNAANPTSLTKLNKAKLGGRSSHTYEYDELNRLVHASGKAKRASYDMVMSFGRMSVWKNLSGNDEHHDLIRRSPKLPGSKLYYKTVSELIGQNKKLKSIFNDASKYYKKHY